MKNIFNICTSVAKCTWANSYALIPILAGISLLVETINSEVREFITIIFFFTSSIAMILLGAIMVKNTYIAYMRTKKMISRFGRMDSRWHKKFTKECSRIGIILAMEEKAIIK